MALAMTAACLMFALFLPAASAVRSAGPGSAREEEVREAMLGIFVHGVTEELARGLVDAGDIPILIDLLADPGFPRRDNVVAFLGWIDDGTATGPLASLMVAPPADLEVPEEYRAMLGAPQSLGLIAARGDRRALEILLEMTRDGGEGGPWLSGVRAGRLPDLQASNMIDAALRGLAWSGRDEARRRIDRIASGWERPLAAGRDPAPAAARELGIFDQLHPGRARRSGSRVSASTSTGSTTGASDLWTLPGAELIDTSTVSHNAVLTYANHTAVGSPMNDARLDLVLRESELRAGREDFPNDVMCCATVERSGTAQSFANTGQDVIDDQQELTQVLNNNVSRVKVVNSILYCNGPGMNILGCGYISGFGVALVRMSTIAEEAVLWLHEYGHNVGLNHVSDPNYIMNAFLSAGAGGLSQVECDHYHVPEDMTTPTQTGTCADTDADKVHDQADNCPFLYNPSQVDTDFDGQGDPCDGDADSDGVMDPNDCLPLDNTVWTVPGEVMPITVTQDPMGTLISWDPPTVPGGIAGSIRYDTLQASSATGFDPGPPFCLESDQGPDTMATTSLAPETAWMGEGNTNAGRFGSAVAFAGDVNNDTWPDLVVGVPGYVNGQDAEGRAMLFLGSDLGPVGPVWASESNFDAAKLGTSVAGGGDVNNDGFDDVAVGAPSWDDGATRIGGVVRVHYGSESALSLAPSWEEDGGTGNMQFGTSVAFAGDIDNDGYDDLIVGAPFLFVTLTNQGTARVYRGSSTGLSTTPDAWNPVGSASGAKLGASVAGAGDVNGDGYDDVIVGAPGLAMGQTAEGVAYVYLGSASGLSMTPQAVLQADQATAAFGGSVAGAGDVNGDGYDDVIVGAKEFDVDQMNEGAAFVFYGSPSGIDPTLGPPLEGDKAMADFGVSVASAGDYNNDGYSDLVVGASTTVINTMNSAGRTYLYLGSAKGPVLYQVIDGDQASAQMGFAVSTAGDTNADGYDDFVTAEPFYTNGQTSEGRAQIFAGILGPDPPPGMIFYYLVRAENACSLGPAGFDSDGLTRTAPNCPLP